MAAGDTLTKAQRELEGLLLDLGGGSRSAAGVISSARARAGVVARAAGDTPEARVRSLVGLVGAGLCRAFLEHDAGGEGVDALLRALARLTNMTREVAAVEVHVASIVDPHLHEIPPRLSIEIQLRLLRALAPVTGASLWVAEDGELHEVARLGDEVPARGAHIAARKVFERRPSDGRAAHGTLCSIPVLRWQRPYAALVARARPRTRERCLAFMEQAAASLSQTLERTYLLERNAARERSLVEAGERRLLRLGYDIHDGPLQDIIALAADVRLFIATFRPSRP